MVELVHLHGQDLSTELILVFNQETFAVILPGDCFCVPAAVKFGQHLMKNSWEMSNLHSRSTFLGGYWHYSAHAMRALLILLGDEASLHGVDLDLSGVNYRTFDL